MKTVRVRIAVAMDSMGNWSSSGWSKKPGVPMKDKELSGYALDAELGETAIVHFIEADVPLPEPQTIQGEVKP